MEQIAYTHLIQQWNDLNRKHGTVVLDANSMEWHRIGEKLDNDNYRFEPLSGEAPFMASIDEYYTLDQYISENQSKINKKSSENQHAISKNQAEISVNQRNFNLLSLILQDYFNLLSEKTQTNITRPEVEKQRTLYLNALEAGNLNAIAKAGNQLRKYKNKVEGSRKARQRPTPTPQTLKLKNHKKVVKLLKNNKFIKHATGGRYKIWKQLPTNCPSSIVDAVRNLQLYTPQGEAYNVVTLTKILAKMKQTQNETPAKVKAIISSIAVLAIIAVFAIKLYNPDMIPAMVEQKQVEKQAQNQPRNIDRQTIINAIEVWEKNYGKEVYQWRENKLIDYVKQSDAQTLMDAVRVVHRYNTEVVPFEKK